MNKNNIHELLTLLKFKQEGNIYTKRYSDAFSPLKVNIEGDGHIYYRECGITVGRETTSNLLEPENMVVLQCVDRLLWKGYNPIHIELEPAWKLGHSTKGGYADIWVRTFKSNGFDGANADKESLLIIECKTWGREFNGAWIDTKEDGAQLFSYFQQEPSTKFLCLYTSDIIEGKVESEYYLINVQDNDKMLANDDKGRSYKDASNNKQKYKVWHDTYKCDYDTRGLFEDDITTYQIGKNKYTISDLKSVDNDTIQKKYNEFALILRQHNVGGHENAFDKLVNLFLAKVVDETNNKDDLHFYWKGAAYDDAFQLQDRLQRLYRDGMKRFLNEEVTYIENSEIEKAFRRFNADPDATKKTIMEYFRALKFFTDNDFSFISVHNKRLFEQNAAILLKVVKMLQDIKLKDSDQNQLLGDLFEGFLNKGVKQSEGQFFTPMPIVRFLVSSLPLEQIIKNNQDVPKAIDYACGAGHFLTEYAMQIKEFAEKHRPDISIQEFCANITGVEKEYRLSKVSKVSAFMYGHDETNIIYADALVPHTDIKDGTYDVLIANPPYSVKGFLETLTEEQRKSFSLFSDNINIGKNNAIETFFIERAAQLLKAGGVAGIILPVSVLNKEGIYARAREIILRKFDIVALAEFGSGTFGKTGTNTVTMFLRRKETNTPDDEHYLNRVNSWFNHHDNADEAYQDIDLLHDYCTHCGYSLDDYKTFMYGTITVDLLANEIFQNYHASFFGNQRNAMKGVCEKAKNIRARFKSKQATKAFRHLPQEEKQRQEQKAFLEFAITIEKEKLYYFILAKTTSNPVVIVKAPSGTTENKRFLGYEWSDSKGNEGIKYLNIGGKTSSNDEEDDAYDDTMQQIRGINGIQTPLFNPSNLAADDKINTVIRRNFDGSDFTIPDKLVNVISVGHLVEMIDFSHTSFNLEIKTSFAAKNEIVGKWPLVTLSDICYIRGGYTFPENLQGNHNKQDIPFYKVSDMNSIGNEIYMADSANYISMQVVKDELNNAKIFNAETIVFPKVGMTIHTNKKRILSRDALVDNNTMGVISKDCNIVINQYLYYYFICNVKLSNIASNANPPSISAANLGLLKIQLPPLPIQQQIVGACEAIDKECQDTRLRIEKIKAEIIKSVNSLQANKETVGANCIINQNSINPLETPDKEFAYIDIDSIENGTGKIIANKKIIGQNAPSRARRIVFADSVVVSTVRPYLRGFAYVNENLEDTIFSTGFAIIQSANQEKLLSKYVYYLFMYSDDLMAQMKTAMPKGSYPSINKNDIESFSIPLQPLKDQRLLVETIDALERECISLQNIIDSSAEKKQAILDKYLK
jgi:Type I restriction-modification system methyltransferase subunit